MLQNPDRFECFLCYGVCGRCDTAGVGYRLQEFSQFLFTGAFAV